MEFRQRHSLIACTIPDVQSHIIERWPKKIYCEMAIIDQPAHAKHSLDSNNYDNKDKDNETFSMSHADDVARLATLQNLIGDQLKSEGSVIFISTFLYC